MKKLLKCLFALLFAAVLTLCVSAACAHADEACGSVTLTGVAILEGRELQEGQFWYELVDAEGNVRSTAMNTADGEIVFPALEYTREDLKVDGGYVDERRFTYTMMEVQRDAGGYTYSDSCYTVTVTVTDNGDGTLTVTAEPNGEEIEFVNTYEAEGSVTLTCAAVLEGRDLEEGQFNFTLEGSGISETVSNTADGRVVFYALTFDQDDLKVDGEYVKSRQFNYNITEVQDDAAGYIYSGNCYAVTVTVTDNGDGTLTVTAEPNGEEIEFINTYEAFGSCTFRGLKVLEGRELTADDVFTFEVTENGSTLLEATNDMDGVIDFGAVEYTLEDVGTHIYTVRETSVDGMGITADTREYDVNVIVMDNGDGTLTIEVYDNDPEGLVFTNVYSASGEVMLQCSLVMLDRELQEGEFVFEMIEDGMVLQTVVNTADGSIPFDPICYTLEDIGYHTYTVRETSEDGSGITVDTREYSVTVCVTDSGDGTLNIAVVSEDSTELTFVNTYSAEGSVTLTGTKNMVGRDLTEGEFIFSVWDSEGRKAAAGANTADGRIVFDTINYTLDDIGTHIYTVTEQDDGDRTIIRSGDIMAIVVVTDGGFGVLEVQTTEGKDSIIFTNTQVNVVKKDSDGNTLVGAELQVLDSEGSVVDYWIMDDEIHAIEGLEYDKEYTLHEVSVPEGYILADDITFNVNTDGSIDCDSLDADGSLLMIGAKTQVKVSKVDMGAGEELEGAMIQIIDKDGNVVDEWVSTDEIHTIEGLKTGEEYILRETVAPEGYTIATDTTFSIDETGKVTTTGTITEDGVILIEDAKTRVKVSKVDMGTGEELEGATIQIIDKDGNVVDEWVSSDEIHTIEGLKTGEEYILRETVAPEGYTIATDTTFAIDETGRVTTTGTITGDGVILIEDERLPVSGTCGADGGNLTWTLAEDRITVSGTGAMADYDINGAPWAGHAYRVTSVEIGSGVTRVGSRAFSEFSLLSRITLPDSLLSVGEGAFRACGSLRDIWYGGSGAQWTDVTVGAYNEALAQAVLRCYPTVILDLPANLSVIGSEAFAGLPGVEGVRIPAGVTRIADDAFDPGMALIVPAGSPWTDWAGAHGYRAFEE